jgi:threonine/homoserine efflux transporter RhtA
MLEAVKPVLLEKVDIIFDAVLNGLSSSSLPYTHPVTPLSHSPSSNYFHVMSLLV